VKVLISIRDAASLLSVSVTTVHRLIRAGDIPTVNVGRRRLIRSAALLEFAKAGHSGSVLAAVERVTK
jgi:excisionase family DNA binding protein